MSDESEQDVQKDPISELGDIVVTKVAEIVGRFDSLKNRFEDPIKVEIEHRPDIEYNQHMTAGLPWVVNRQREYMYVWSGDAESLTLSATDNPNISKTITAGQWNEFTIPPNTIVTSASDAQFFVRDTDHKQNIPSAGGGGGGGAVTIADGADVTLGAKADTAITNPSSSATVIALLKGLLTQLQSTLLVDFTNATTSTLTSVGTSTTTAVLLAANTNRLAASVFNDSANNLYIALKSTASSSSYTVKVPAFGFYELPNFPEYTGIISGILDAGTGNARITELTP